MCRAPDSVSEPMSLRTPTMATMPLRSIRQAQDIALAGACQVHSSTCMKPIPCIFPSGSFRVPGGCHFRSQSMAAFPFSITSRRLQRSGKPFSLW